MRRNYITNNVDIDTKILVNKNIAKATDLGPSNLRVCISEFRWKMVCSLTDDLQISLHCIIRHIRKERIGAIECCEIPGAAFYSLQ